VHESEGVNTTLGAALFIADPLSKATYATLMRYHQAWRRRDLDGLMALYHPDVEYNDFFQNRQIAPSELRDYLAASMPSGEEERQAYTDRLRVDGDTAFLQYQVTLRGTAGLMSFRASEALNVRDGLIWRVNEYAMLVGKSTSTRRSDDGRLAVSRLGLSVRQLSTLAEDIEQYFRTRQPFLDPELNLQHVAAATGYTRNQISFFLNQVQKQSFYQYLNGLRLSYLKAALESADDVTRIDDLARAAGFKSLSTFYRCFRAETGLSPKAYLTQRQD
jgi:AraC-like DNA-binding protein/ketosteroid isomerase-like protein